METLTSPYLCRAQGVLLGHGKAQLNEVPLEFTFPRGGVIGLIGRNGAGKTTLLRALIGESTLKSGAIYLWDWRESVAGMSPSRLANQIAFVSQEQIFPGHLSVFDMLSLAFLPGLGWFGRLTDEHREQIVQALESFAIRDLSTKRVGEISTGERQRAALARAFLQRPQLLLLDEPTNHLDPGARHHFWEVLARAVRELSCDVIVSSHDLDRLRQHATWICALERGSIRYNGPADPFWSGTGVREVFGISAALLSCGLNR